MIEDQFLQERIEDDGFVACKTKGRSMLPFIVEKRDTVIITKVDREIKKYDVVLYKNDKDNYVLHRIVGIDDDNYYIRGDNNTNIETIKKPLILGILSSIYNNKFLNITEKINKKYYFISIVSLPIRKIKNIIRSKK